MKKQLKIAAATVMLALTATTSFALDFAPADISNTSATDVGTFEADAITEINVAYGASTAEQSIALVAQTGDKNIAYVNQSGSGNFAAIVQDAMANAGNAAYAIQTGDTNRTVIIQR